MDNKLTSIFLFSFSQVWVAIAKVGWNPDEKEREKGFEEALEGLKILENELKDKFFNGDSIGIVDITGLFIAYWLPIIQEAGEFELINGDKFPKLHKWSQEIVNHPIVKPLLPPRDYLFPLFNNFVKKATTS